MAFKASGSDITANWTTAGSSAGITTGYKESGTDIGAIYTDCGGHTCSGVTPNPACAAFPGTYLRNGAFITTDFWTGVCTP